VRRAAALLLAVAALGACGGGDDEPARSQADLDARLIEAAFANDVPVAERLIRQGADVVLREAGARGGLRP
jgi:hypothetical protein